MIPDDIPQVRDNPLVKILKDFANARNDRKFYTKITIVDDTGIRVCMWTRNNSDNKYMDRWAAFDWGTLIFMPEGHAEYTMQLMERSLTKSIQEYEAKKNGG